MNNNTAKYIKSKEWKKAIYSNNTILDYDEYINDIYNELYISFKDDDSEYKKTYIDNKAKWISRNINQSKQYRKESYEYIGDETYNDVFDEIVDESEDGTDGWIHDYYDPKQLYTEIWYALTVDCKNENQINNAAKVYNIIHTYSICDDAKIQTLCDTYGISTQLFNYYCRKIKHNEYIYGYWQKYYGNSRLRKIIERNEWMETPDGAEYIEETYGTKIIKSPYDIKTGKILDPNYKLIKHTVKK